MVPSKRMRLIERAVFESTAGGGRGNERVEYDISQDLPAAAGVQDVQQAEINGVVVLGPFTSATLLTKIAAASSDVVNSGRHELQWPKVVFDIVDGRSVPTLKFS